MRSHKWQAQLFAAAIVWWVACPWLASAQTGADVYQQELKKLDGARPESVCVARDLLRELMPKANADERDTMFRGFRLFYIRSGAMSGSAFSAAMYRYTGDYEQWMTTTGSDSVHGFLKERPDIAKAGASWFRCGFSMQDQEGNLNPAQKPDFLLEFADKLEPGLGDYVRFRSNEDRVVIMGDACLLISWEQLRMRLERWEAFGRDHPKLLETKSEVEPEVSWLARTYLFGSDNTPIYDFTNDHVAEGLLSSWSNFADHDESSRYHALISSLVKNLSGQNQKIAQTDRPLFVLVGLGKEFDQWWRWYQFRMTGKTRFRRQPNWKPYNFSSYR